MVCCCCCDETELSGWELPLECKKRQNAPLTKTEQQHGQPAEMMNNRRGSGAVVKREQQHMEAEEPDDGAALTGGCYELERELKLEIAEEEGEA